MFGRKRFSYTIPLIIQIAMCSPYFEEEFIESNVGTIRGMRATDGNYFMYLGIPYATVDARNPFGPSKPRSLTEKTFEAYDDSHICPQIHKNNYSVTGTLDCLRLNIYVPESVNSINRNFPVMIWIYGGSFQYGYAAKSLYEPSYLIQHDVIVVTFNYRTGPYGFMCLDIPEVPGNQGLKDQYIALQWVKDNIEAFGGNPNQITLFGMGAGAHSIDFHLMSTKDILFNKVILQSGSAQSATVIHEPDKSAPLKIARYVGFETTDVKDALYFLSKTDIKLVIAAANNLEIQFKPCVESLFEYVDPYIAYPWINLKVPKVKNMPVMIGFNKHELARFFMPKNAAYFNNLTIVYDNLNQIFQFTKDDIYEMEKLISRFYFGGEEISEKMKWKVIRFSSDFTYIHPIYRTIYKYLKNGAGNIYYYMLSYVGGRNAVNVTEYDEEKTNNYLCCASHSDDLGYLFRMQNQPELTDADNTVMQRMTTMWTNFAKHSDPTPMTSDLLPVKWEPFKINAHYFLNIDTRLWLRKNPLHDKMAFWDLFYRQNKKYQKGYEEKTRDRLN